MWQYPGTFLYHLCQKQNWRQTLNCCKISKGSCNCCDEVHEITHGLWCQKQNWRPKQDKKIAAKFQRFQAIVVRWLTSATGTGLVDWSHRDSQHPISARQVALRNTGGEEADPSPISQAKVVPPILASLGAFEESYIKEGMKGAKKKCMTEKSVTRAATGSTNCHDHHRDSILLLQILRARSASACITNPQLWFIPNVAKNRQECMEHLVTLFRISVTQDFGANSRWWCHFHGRCPSFWPGT